MGISILFALLHGFATITHRGDQVVSGMAINILAAGLTVTWGYWFDQGGQTPALSRCGTFAPIDLPGARSSMTCLSSASSIQRALEQSLCWSTWPSPPCPGLVGAVPVPASACGCAVGEAPAAVDTAGISVVRMRYTALIIGGLLAGIGGTCLAVAQTAQFIPNMSAGKGFMALAALVFGKWRPGTPWRPVCYSGFLDAVAIRLQRGRIGDFPIPVQAIGRALPYIPGLRWPVSSQGGGPKASALPMSRSGMFSRPSCHAKGPHMRQC